MAKVTIFSVDDGNGFTYHTVYRDSDNPSNVTTKQFTYVDGQPPYPTYSDGDLVGFTCDDTTLTGYRYQSTIPFAYYTVEYNAPMCGYAPSCDLTEVSFSKTDETAAGANDGTANLFCTSTYPPIFYQVLGLTVGNTTGYFTGIPPGDYILQASDANDCIIQQPFTIVAFDTSKTHYKYRLQFESIKGGDTWEVRLLDMYNSYDPDLYPKDVNGTESPLILKQDDPNEDKTTSIISKSADINLEYDGLIFNIDEFALAQERQWKVEVYLNGSMEFQGWLLPDQTQNEYSDPVYTVTLQATDGLPSLKGNKWGDGSGGKGYSDAQIQQYGVTAWALLVKQCLDQLGYDYGNSILLNSLRYNGAQGWVNWGTWSDVLYDTEGVPTDTYTALDLLLFGMKLTIMQDKGQFVFVNWNDMFYLPNGSKYDDFKASLFEISAGFNSVVNTGADVRLPLIQYVGFNQSIRPINPKQSLNYDKAYNISNKIDFNLLALLYQNPSFEIGAVEGELPVGWQDNAPNTAYSHEEGDLAYLGDWVLRIEGHCNFEAISYIAIDAGVSKDGLMDSFAAVYFTDGFILDQFDKLLNIEFKWRPVFYSNTFSPEPVISILLTANSGTLYYFSLNTNQWLTYSSGDLHASVIGSGHITDYNAWNTFNLTTTLIPEQGTIYFYFWGAAPAADGGHHGAQNATVKTYDVDSLNLTFGDARDTYSKQTGEVHAITAVTGIPQANTKEISSKLFTYGNNKRVSGNVFSAATYATGSVDNKWKFNLKSGDIEDRLPATITKAIGRNYQRQFRIFEGDISASYLSFYGIFILKFYESSVFMPWSIEFDARNNVGHLIMVEISDNDQQAIYTYTPVFEKSARQVSN